MFAVSSLMLQFCELAVNNMSEQMRCQLVERDRDYRVSVREMQ